MKFIYSCIDEKKKAAFLKHFQEDSYDYKEEFLNSYIRENNYKALKDNLKLDKLPQFGTMDEEGNSIPPIEEFENI